MASSSAKVIPVRVAVRIRPISKKELEEGCQNAVQVIAGRPQVHIPSLDKAFTFDFAYESDTSQADVYDSSVKCMIEKLFEGFNATVLAYGQTGSGKTYSMGTAYNSESTPVDLAGIIPRAMHDIFDEISKRSSEYDVDTHVSFVELYREQLYDLLSSKSAKKENCTCDLREDPVKGVVIPGLTENKVVSTSEAMRQLEAGSNKRVTAATAMNLTSSRSHAIFTLTLNVAKKETPSDAMVSKFHLVDLAGSERCEKTKAEGQRLKEGVAINQGLLALGNVISALGEGKAARHVPYRNSKLTRMLQDSLGGNSHTLMISCLSPADSNLDETLGTLRYSDRARKIKNKPIVNLSGNEMEINRLRLENEELRIQIAKCSAAGGAAPGAASGEESEALRKTNEKLRAENRELTKALVACQDELTHMNEMVLLQESASERLMTKCQEVAAVLDEKISQDIPDKEDFRQLRRAIDELIYLQKDTEKTLREHELSRVDVSVSPGDDTDDDVDADDAQHQEDEFGAAHALKQNALATQLNNLNKLLAQKEKLASTMSANDEKMQEMRKKYEESVNKLEVEISTLQKEKDEIWQQHRNSGHDAASSKLSEQRRKKIQELETQIKELRKTMQEQQRAIKTNEKNEARVKKLAEEIRGMKQQKVKLIRQIKEDAENVRQWKAQKEKEVRKLKESERKQQVKIAKMETLHSKQQNVLRRKMEQAMSVNKRLLDVVARQKANKSDKMNSSSLVGAGERVRNWINEQMDLVVSVKEAMTTRQQLINDRKVLNKELNKLREKQRQTLTGDEIEENTRKMQELQTDLDQRNVQINNLQKQIASLDQDSGKQGDKGRFDTIRTVTEAKIALEHIFDKVVDQSVCYGQTKSEHEELKQLYGESIKNINVLEKEISTLKHEHQTELVQMNREHEEKVLYVFKSMSDSGGKIPQAEIKQFSKLHEELAKLSEENDKLRQMHLDNETKPTMKKRCLPKVQVSYEEFMAEVSDTSDEEEAYDDADPDWINTPLFKRIKTIRRTKHALQESFNSTYSRKRKNSSEEEEDLRLGAKPQKRASSMDNKCGCKNGCGTNRCKCHKSKTVCGETCSCNKEICKNKVLGDITSSGNDDTANTMSLLSDSFTTSVLDAPNKKRFTFSPGSKVALPRKSIFNSPLDKENNVESIELTSDAQR